MTLPGIEPGTSYSAMQCLNQLQTYECYVHIVVVRSHRVYTVLIIFKTFLREDVEDIYIYTAVI